MIILDAVIAHLSSIWKKGSFDWSLAWREVMAWVFIPKVVRPIRSFLFIPY